MSFHGPKLKILGRNLVLKTVLSCIVVFVLFMNMLLQDMPFCKNFTRVLHRIPSTTMRFSRLSSQISTNDSSITNTGQLLNYTFLQRYVALKSGCKALDKILPGNLSNVQFFTNKRLGLNYCKVPKAGSTFWMNFFLIMYGIYSESAFNRRARFEAHVAANDKLVQPVSVSSIKDKDTTVMIARDPYQRLFSAYMDKIYVPLYIEDAMEIARIGKRVCYRENSFEDFLNYVTEADQVLQDQRRDVHWTPIYYLCLPCDIPYNVIIKSEEFSTETGYLLRSLNLTNSEYKLFSKVLNSQNIDVSVQMKLREVLRMMLYYDVKNKSCMTYFEIMERVWNSFKAQGYICQGVPVPSAFKMMYYFQITETIKIVLEAVKSCQMTPDQRNKQRMIYLSKAYRSVSERAIRAIRRDFAPDFVLFNYSQAPPK